MPLLVVEKPAHSKTQDVRIILGAYEKFQSWQKGWTFAELELAAIRNPNNAST